MLRFRYLLDQGAGINYKNAQGRTLLDRYPLDPYNNSVRNRLLENGAKRSQDLQDRLIGSAKTMEVNGGGSTIKTGEIGLRGRITSVDLGNKSFVLEATSWMATGGKMTILSQPKSKVVSWNEKTLCSMAKDVNQTMTPEILKVDNTVPVVGADKGTGQDLPAHQIIIFP